MNFSQNFDLQPHLKCSLIAIRPLRSDDFEKLFACASDPLIWEQHPQSNRYQLPIFQKFFEDAMSCGGAFVIIDQATGEYAGSSRYYDLDEANSHVTIGYTFLARKYWGGKFNRKLKSLMLTHAFKFVDSVRFEIGESNIRSRKAIEKLGAILIDRQQLDDNPHVVYQINKINFLE